MLQWQHQTAGAHLRKFSRPTEAEMYTKSSLILIIAVAFLTLAGMGAAKFVAPQTAGYQPGRGGALRLWDQTTRHADALADAPQTANYRELGRAEALRLWDQMTRHADALADAPQTANYRELGRAEALRLWDQMTRHADALADAP